MRDKPEMRNCFQCEVSLNMSQAKKGILLVNDYSPNVRQLLVANDHTHFFNLVAQGAFGSGESQIIKAQPNGKLSKINIRRVPNSIGVSTSDSSVLYMTASDDSSAWRYLTAGTALMKSEDGGFSWETLDLLKGLHLNAGDSVIAGLRSLAVSPLSPKTAYVLLTLWNPHTNVGVLKLAATSDGGLTWLVSAAPPVPGSPFTSVITCDPKALNTAYAALNDKMLRTTNGGLTWTQLPIKAGTINDVAVNSELPQRLYVASDTGAWTSGNAGATWYPLASRLRQEKLKKVVSVGQITLAQGYYGIYRLTTEDLGWAKARWQEFEQNPASNTLAFDPVRVERPAPPSQSSLQIPGPLEISGNTAVLQPAGGGSGVGGLVAEWDKALRNGQSISIAVCHDRGGFVVRNCEQGTLSLGPKEVSFSTSTTLFAVPFSQVTIRKDPILVGVFVIQVARKSQRFQYVPIGVECPDRMEAFAACPPQGVEQQTAVADYIARTIRKLVSGSMNVPQEE